MKSHSQGFERQLVLTLDQIHGVPYGEGSWETALTAVSNLLGAECVDLSFLDAELLQCTRWEFARIDVSAAQHYLSNYLTADVRDVHPRMLLAMSMREDQVVADADFWSIQERNKKTFFAEYYGPLAHCTECVMGTVRRKDDDGPWAMLATHFGSDDVPQRDLRDRVSMLLPHIRRALGAEIRLQQLRQENRALSEALDQMPDAVVMLDRSGKAKRFNRAAENVFRRNCGVALATDRRLLLPTTETRAALALALARCADPLLIDGQTKPPDPIYVRQRTGRPLVLTLQPMPRETAAAFGAVALLFIAAPEHEQAAESAVVQAAYGLSAAETRLVKGLVSGLTLKQIAAAHGVSYDTLRKQLRNVFDKTGVSRQADLIRLGLSTK